MGLATSMIGSEHMHFVVFGYAIGVLMIIMGFNKKMRTILAGYKELTFIIQDYTFIHSHQKKPTGLLLLPTDKSYKGAFFHVAVSQETIPTIGSIIRVVVPGDAKLRCYNNRVYFSQIYGYEEEQKRR